MPAQGRKNVHGKAGVRFRAGYTASKNKSMLRNVVSELIVHGQVKVTSGVTPELVTLAEKMVTFAKQGDLAGRREAMKVIRPGIVDGRSQQVVVSPVAHMHQLCLLKRLKPASWIASRSAWIPSFDRFPHKQSTHISG